MARKTASGFYQDESGRTRPITKKSVGSALARGVTIRRVVDPSGRKVEKDVPLPDIPESDEYDAEYLTKLGYHLGDRGWFKMNPSSSSDKVYETIGWTTHTSRFSPGDVTCNCKGWIFSKKSPKSCRHTNAMRGDLTHARRVRAAEEFREQVRPSPKAGDINPPSISSASAISRFEQEFKVSTGYTADEDGILMNDDHTVLLVTDSSKAGTYAPMTKGQPLRELYNDLPPAFWKNEVGVVVQIGKGNYRKKLIQKVVLILGGKGIAFSSPYGSEGPVGVSSSGGGTIVVAPIIITDEVPTVLKKAVKKSKRAS